jgi:hypothetical protein
VSVDERHSDDYEIVVPPATEVVFPESCCEKWEQFYQLLDHFVGAKIPGPVILFSIAMSSDPPNTTEVNNK